MKENQKFRQLVSSISRIFSEFTLVDWQNKNKLEYLLELIIFLYLKKCGQRDFGDMFKGRLDVIFNYIYVLDGRINPTFK